MNKNSFIILGIVMLVAAIGYIAYTKTAPKNTAGNVATIPISIDVAIQKPGNSITINSVTLIKKGFVVAHREENGKPGEIIGVSSILPEGENKNITVPLTRSTKDGEIIYVLAHIDGNDDNTFLFPGPDIPATDSSGTTVMSRVAVAGELPTGQGTATEPIAQESTVAYTEKGFSPQITEIKVGQVVTFVNTSDSKMWVASDPYPDNTDLTTFNQRTGVGTGGKYSYMFTKVGTWGYHNDLDPDKSGKVIVK